MRGGVDSSRKARGNDEAFKPELGDKLACQLLPNGRTVARADHGDNWRFSKLEPLTYMRGGGASTWASAGG